MVDSLGAWPGFIIMFTGSLHPNCPFFPPLLVSHGDALLVYQLLFSQVSSLESYNFSWCNCLAFAWLKFLIGFFVGCTCWVFYGSSVTISTLRGSVFVNGSGCDEFSFGIFHILPVRVSLGMLPNGNPWRYCWGVAFLNFSARDINASLCEFPILPSGISIAGLCSVKIKSCAVWIVASVEEMFGMMNYLGRNSTVSDITSALDSGMYALWHL